MNFFYTDEIRLIRCGNGILSEIPLVEVDLKSNFSDGPVLLGVFDHLPDNVDFLIGNDLDSGSKIESVNVVTRLQVKKLLCVDQNDDATGDANNDRNNSRVVIDRSNETSKLGDKVGDFDD